MPVKRSRVGSSSAYHETLFATLSPVKVVKTVAAAEKPVSDCESSRTKIGEFLERCHFCSNRIGQDSDVFMYSNLCAFCSVECRDCQINLDQSATKKPEDHQQKKCLCAKHKSRLKSFTLELAMSVVLFGIFLIEGFAITRGRLDTKCA